MKSEIPQTYNRAATALVRARSYLEQACDEVMLAYEILATPRNPAAVWPPECPDNELVLQSLKDFLERLASRHPVPHEEQEV